MASASAPRRSTPREFVEEVTDALIVNLDLPGGGFFMPLFVTLTEGAVLDDALRRKIGDRLRGQYTARHVPDQIIAVPAIPATLTGKKMEVPVRKILLGAEPDEDANPQCHGEPAGPGRLRPLREHPAVSDC